MLFVPIHFKGAYTRDSQNRLKRVFDPYKEHLQNMIIVYSYF